MKRLASVLLLFSFATFAMAHEPLAPRNIPSSFTVSQTIMKIEQAINNRGGKVFMKIDYQKIAQTRGITLRPNQLLVVGKFFPTKGAGPQLIAADPLLAIDLPLKILVFEDNHGEVQISYTDGSYLRQRYQLNGKEEFTRMIDRLMQEVIDESLHGDGK